MTRSGIGVIALLLLPAFVQSAEPGPYHAAPPLAPQTTGVLPMPTQPSIQEPSSAAGPGGGYRGGPTGMPGYGSPGYFGGGPRTPWSRTYHGRRLIGGPENPQSTSPVGAVADSPEAGTSATGETTSPAYGGAQGYGAEPQVPCGPGYPGYYGRPPRGSYGPGYYTREPAGPYGPGFSRGEPETGYVSGPELHVERDSTSDAYIVRIHTRKDVDPATVDVQQRGRQLLIRVSRSNQANYQNDQMAGYRRSYSVSYSSHVSRRLTLPRDADVSAMQREDGDGMVTLTFPRTQRY